MTNNILLFPILLPAAAAVLVFLIRSRISWAREYLAVAVTLANLVLACKLFGGSMIYSRPWGGFGLDFSLRLDHLSGFILVAIAFFAFLISLYSAAFMRSGNYLNQFYAYFLITLSFASGAVLAENLIVLLFFWEGLLLTLFGMIIIGSKGAFKTAIKAFIIVGVTDLCLMFGIGLTGYLSGTFEISKVNLAMNGLGAAAYIFLMIGAISKAGSMPFHSWIPDAALDAPLPFMAFLPGALEKLLGIYFLARISLYMFKLTAGSWMSVLLMTIGAVTILFAVMMALVQKNYKRLLSYHAISQVGYMILGIGTALPVGIIGGLFHMVNNALYKSCLFLTGGAVEKQAGTTDLAKLGGLRSKMPLTFICFAITACSISGVPPFNGFFSKELLYDAALERNIIFYLAAVIGSFFTAASFLKLGHAAFLGKLKDENNNVKEAPASMLVPMIVLACVCIFFGLFNSVPLNLIRPVLGAEAAAEPFHMNIILVIITLLVLAGALINHLLGTKKAGSGLGAVDHIHYAPVLSGIYDRAEKRQFDPYDIGMKIAGLAAKAVWYVDRGIDYFYDGLTVSVTYAFTSIIKQLHNGSYSTYILWALAGVILTVLYSLI